MDIKNEAKRSAGVELDDLLPTESKKTIFNGNQPITGSALLTEIFQERVRIA